jgi:hypothetical protein
MMSSPHRLFAKPLPLGFRRDGHLPDGAKGRDSAAQRVSLEEVLAAGGGLIVTLAPQPL